MQVATRTPYDVDFAPFGRSRSGPRRNPATGRNGSLQGQGTLVPGSRQSVNDAALDRTPMIALGLSSVLAAMEINARFDDRSEPATVSVPVEDGSEDSRPAAAPDAVDRLLESILGRS